MKKIINVNVCIKYRRGYETWTDWKDCKYIADVYRMSKEDKICDYQIALFYYDVNTNEEIGWNPGIVICQGKKMSGENFPKCLEIFS